MKVVIHFITFDGSTISTAVLEIYVSPIWGNCVRET